MAITWNDNMSTGVAEIDAQHQELFRQLNALTVALSNGAGVQQVKGTLDFLLAYAQKHFKFEEQCMAQHRCPVAGANKQAHDQLIQILTVKRAAFEAKGANSAAAIDLQQMISAWLKTHIMNIDTKLRPCVNQRAA